MFTPIMPLPGTSSGKGLKACQFDTEQIPLVWEYLEPFIERSCKKSQGMMTLSRVYQYLCSGQATAFATYRGLDLVAVVIVMIVDFEQYRTARIIACAGTDLLSAMRFFDVLEGWALKQEAVEIEGWCRPAMVRLTRRFGFKPKFVSVTRDLRGKLQ